MNFKDLHLTSIGDTVQMVGAVYAGQNGSDPTPRAFLCLFPEDADARDLPLEVLQMDAEEWKVFLRQTDLMETEVITKSSDGVLTKAMVRKSSRSVDQVVNWACFRRDDYTCRYCGNNRIPLTVDHLVRWEEGGPSIEANMLSACKKCNKTRGDKSYAEWLQHEYYLRVSKNLTDAVRAANAALVPTLDAIPRKYHITSR